jgi:hypothetical protein
MRIANLIRNVPFLLIACCRWVSAGAKPCAAVCAARLGRSAGGHPNQRRLLRSIQPLQLHSLLIAVQPGMSRGRLTPRVLSWLAAWLTSARPAPLLSIAPLQHLRCVHQPQHLALHSRQNLCSSKFPRTHRCSLEPDLLWKSQCGDISNSG